MQLKSDSITLSINDEGDDDHISQSVDAIKAELLKCITTPEASSYVNHDLNQSFSVDVVKHNVYIIHYVENEC